MAYASISGRARTSARRPQAHAICDRCGFRYNHSTLNWQCDWRGRALQNLRLLVCPRCNDKPQEQLRTIVLPPDPVGILNARPEPFAADATDQRWLAQPTQLDPTTGLPLPPSTYRVTEDGRTRTTMAVGDPNGLDPDAIMPPKGTPLPVASVMSDGAGTVTVTCSMTHGLSTGSQIAAEGLMDPHACGFFSVTVTTGTAFTYQPGKVPHAGTLITGHTRITTALVGLPWGSTTIPVTGGAP